MNQTEYQAQVCLENAHTAIHQAIDLLKKDSISQSKQKQAQAVQMLATALSYL